MRRKFNFEIFIVIVLLAVVAAILVWAFRGKKSEPNKQNAQQQTEQPAQAEAINGAMVDPAKVQRPFAVMIENHVDARPQSGLSQADMVYEALAEGGITRFMAVYQTQDVSKIGPVRSARTYFNDWAQQLCAIYAHVGGNVRALDEIKSGIPCLNDADQFYNDPYFTRITSRQAPHNTYTSTSNLLKLAQAHNYSMEAKYQMLSFKDDEPAQTPQVSNISINFSTPSYAVRYQYDQSLNSYKRTIAGKADIDAGNNSPIQPKVVIAEVVQTTSVPNDPKLTLNMDTKSGGAATVFQDGKKITGQWRLVKGRVKYFDQSGNEIKLDRGQIWIEIVPALETVASS